MEKEKSETVFLYHLNETVDVSCKNEEGALDGGKMFLLLHKIEGGGGCGCREIIYRKKCSGR